MRLSFSSIIPVYLSLLALEAALVWLVRSQARKRGITIRELVGGRWTTPLDFVRDVVIAALMWGAWKLAMYGWALLQPTSTNITVRSMLPHGPVAIVLWIALSITAGFAEELAFRGYLQRRLHEATGRWAFAVLGQAIIFGVLHGYEGAVVAARITLYGAIFGAVALWRKSLRPGMIAHAWTDIAAGVFGI